MKEICLEIPEGDKHRDVRGMYNDICESLGEDEVKRIIQHNLDPALEELVENIYKNRDRVEESIENA